MDIQDLPDWKAKAEALAGEVILQATNEDDRFTIVAGVISTLAQYLADTVE